MRGTLTIARRELASMFRLPVGWVTIALFAVVSAAVFVIATLHPGEPASLRAFFVFASGLLIVLAPAISMRLLSEEQRSGTIEPLMTAPVSDLAIAAGKYLAACAYLVLMLVPTLVLVALLSMIANGPLDPGPILAGYLSLVLAGTLYLAIGLVASALTASQTLAFLGTFLALLVILAAPRQVGIRLPEPYSSWAFALSITDRIDDFAKGIIDTGHIVFFVSTAAWFVLVAYVVLASRRWR